MANVAQNLVGNSIGPYDILSVLGEGGMGIVYKGVHRVLDQHVAIKALGTGVAVSDEMRGRFLQEARIQAKLVHPNIVNLLNFVEEAGSFYLVMEFIEGETLEALIRRVGLIPPERTTAISQQVLNALAFAHQKGVIHRDIKPSNIMITKAGIVKITDFGIAKIMGAGHHTATGIRPGTLWYMSPEQVKGETLDSRADIYSFGVMLYEMVTGKLPFDADSEYGIMRAHVELQPPPPRQFYPHVPEHLERAVLKCLAKNPADRFQTAVELSEAIGGKSDITSAFSAPAIQVSSPTGAPTPSVFERIAAYRRVGWGVAFLALALLVYFILDESLSKPPIPPSQPSTAPVTAAGLGNEPLEKPAKPPESQIAPSQKEPKVPAKDNIDHAKVNEHVRMANSYWVSGNYSQAVGEFENARSLDPQNREVLESLDKVKKAWKAEERLAR
jgi:serine/threonine protein kinase